MPHVLWKLISTPRSDLPNISFLCVQVFFLHIWYLQVDVRVQLSKQVSSLIVFMVTFCCLWDKYWYPHSLFTSEKIPLKSVIILVQYKKKGSDVISVEKCVSQFTCLWKRAKDTWSCYWFLTQVREGFQSFTWSKREVFKIWTLIYLHCCAWKYLWVLDHIYCTF